MSPLSTEVWLAIYNLVMDPELPLAGLKHMANEGGITVEKSKSSLFGLHFYIFLPLAH